MDENGDGEVDRTFPIDFDGTIEAEKAMNVSHVNSSGSFVKTVVSKTKMNPVIVIIEKVKNIWIIL